MALIHYAGIGSRETPPQTLNFMQRLANRFAELGFVLRSGAAIGADQAFESGCDDAHGAKEIWLPFEGFEKHQSQLYPSAAAFEMASQHHPVWHKLSNRFRAMHARNCHQVLGADLKTPVNFVVCWTKDGCESKEHRTDDTGGTGTAIEVASVNRIPVFNLANEDAMPRLTELVETIKTRLANKAVQEAVSEEDHYDEFIKAVIDIFDATVFSYKRHGE